MKEEHGFNADLKQINQIVMPPDVGQLVGEQRLELPQSQTSQTLSWDQPGGPEPADHGGNFDTRREQPGDAPAEAGSLHEAAR